MYLALYQAKWNTRLTNRSIDVHVYYPYNIKYSL